MKKIYAGIGSRETPPNVLALMTKIARTLAAEEYLLRSGGAKGADQAFERGAISMEIYLPWHGYENHIANWKTVFVDLPQWAFDKAKEFHPAWDVVRPDGTPVLKQGAKKLHARNSLIMFGNKMPNLVDFVICWTEGGKGEGGTGQALRMAKKYQLPILDLGCWKTIAAMEEAFSFFMQQRRGT